MKVEPVRGILLPIFSLPNAYDIGNFGASAYRWIDLLKKMHLNAWQICPLGPTGFGNSPYQPLSELALNPLFIDMDDLYKRGWISPKTLNNLKGTQGNVRYDAYKAKQHPIYFLH